MLVRKVGRGGFSLTEVLVALAIIAIMSAVLFPAVNSQLGKSDAARAATDLTAIQTAIQSFMGDVHRAPQSTGQLLYRITTAHSDLGNSNASTSPAAYADYLAANWRGPYLNREVVGPTRVGDIQNLFSVTTVGSNTYYVTVNMTNVQHKDFALIEEMLDEGTNASASATSGTVRYTGTTLSFLAAPLY